MEDYWQVKGDHLVNETQLEVMADCRKRQEGRSERARKAAEARWSKAEEQPEQCSSNAQAKLKQ